MTNREREWIGRLSLDRAEQLYTYGAWDLPPGPGQTGQASGVLVVDQSGEPLFSLDATLTEGPPPMEFRLGEISIKALHLTGPA